MEDAVVGAAVADTAPYQEPEPVLEKRAQPKTKPRQSAQNVHDSATADINYGISTSLTSANDFIFVDEGNIFSYSDLDMNELHRAIDIICLSSNIEDVNKQYVSAKIIACLVACKHELQLKTIPKWTNRPASTKTMSPPDFILHFYAGGDSSAIISTDMIRTNDLKLLIAYENYCNYHGRDAVSFRLQPKISPRNQTPRDKKFEERYNGSASKILEDVREAGRRWQKTYRAKTNSRPGKGPRIQP